MKKILNILLILTLILAATATAEETGESKIIKDSLESKIIGETRPLHIILPDGYTKDKKYPVVIALDGNANYTSSVAPDMLASHKDLIVVLVENVNRPRDMFPDKAKSRGGAGGGGDKFLKFITTELIPYIDGKYSTNGFRIISGQSNSAFFVLYMLLTSPESFDAYLAASPMIGWDKEMIHEKTKALMASGKASGKILFMNQGEIKELRYVTNFMPEYENLLKKTAPKDFRWINEFVKDDGHVPGTSYTNGMKFIFKK